MLWFSSSSVTLQTNKQECLSLKWLLNLISKLSNPQTQHQVFSSSIMLYTNKLECP
jgi:hypothetical protein